jgi:hypothetical protein
MNIVIADRWIHGEGTETETEYLVRTVPPRCIVQIESDETGALLAPIVVVNEYGEGFAVVAWIDPEPDEMTHRAMLAEAIAARHLLMNQCDN